LLDRDGVMSLDPSVIERMDSGSFAKALDFFASEDEGLASMADHFELFSDPVTGFIQVENNNLNQANDRYGSQIETLNLRINSMQASLLTKLQAADGLLASLQSQKDMLDATIESLNTVTNGRRED
jgi:flagellar capping protein FliD